MRDEVLRALAIDGSSPLAARTIDITTTGRQSGAPRRIEIVFYRYQEDIYLSGIPGSTRRSWLANLNADPRFIFHLKNDVVADLPAIATVIVDPAERERILGVFVDEYNRRRTPDGAWPEAVLAQWVKHSPLARITFQNDS